MKDEKEYVGEVTLGATSNTDDAEGEIEEANISEDVIPTENDILNVMSNFVGNISQMPPQFSAKKIKGQRAYDIARKGGKAELKKADITVHDIKLMTYDWPVFKMHVHCGTGTYIRSLARDMGEQLKCGGYLSSLLRTRVGAYTLDQACLLETMNEASIMPMASALQHLQSYNLSEVEYKTLRDGKTLDTNLIGPLALGMLLGNAAIIIKIENGKMKLEKLLQL